MYIVEVRYEIEIAMGFIQGLRRALEQGIGKGEASSQGRALPTECDTSHATVINLYTSLAKRQPSSK